MPQLAGRVTDTGQRLPGRLREQNCCVAFSSRGCFRPMSTQPLADPGWPLQPPPPVPPALLGPHRSGALGRKRAAPSPCHRSSKDGWSLGEVWARALPGPLALVRAQNRATRWARRVLRKQASVLLQGFASRLSAPGCGGAPQSRGSAGLCSPVQPPQRQLGQTRLLLGTS